MENSHGNLQETLVPQTLDSEIRVFANSLPYWGKYLADILLSTGETGDDNINQAYQYLLEDLGLSEQTERLDLIITGVFNSDDNYFEQVTLSKVDNVEGVNALAAHQKLEFAPQLTVIYGINGAGKTGYVRLFKNAFYAIESEKPLPNINSDPVNMQMNASFVFDTDGDEIKFELIDATNHAVFKQFSVFDGKIANVHLTEKNEFEFKPSGLKFFSAFSTCVQNVEELLKEDIRARSTTVNYEGIFSSTSPIKTFVEGLSENSNISLLKGYLPFTDEDEIELKTKIKRHDDLVISIGTKEKVIKEKESTIRIIQHDLERIRNINKYFKEEAGEKINSLLNNYQKTAEQVNKIGLKQFETQLIVSTGSEEWRNFIIAAHKFSINQSTEGQPSYPTESSNCLFCRQPLSEEAVLLVQNYWKYVESKAESDLADHGAKLDNIQKIYESLNFDLYSEADATAIWMKENNPQYLQHLKASISQLEGIRREVVKCLKERSTYNGDYFQVEFLGHEDTVSSLERELVEIRGSNQNVELNEIIMARNLLEDRKKLMGRIEEIEKYINDLNWIKKAKKADFKKKAITIEEKSLSTRFFNDAYVDAFEEECTKLDGKFGVDISHTGSGGTSYRQLTLKGKNPADVLSEGEQKVIALADFISEARCAEVNKGLIFDDPVNSLDNNRKRCIAKRLVEISSERQIVIFTHDLMFLYELERASDGSSINISTHWMEARDGVPGYIYLNNSPSHEKTYRSASVSRNILENAKKNKESPEKRDYLIAQGFSALRTSYEVLVINDLFKNTVQRYEERIGFINIEKVVVTKEITSELFDNFSRCCRFMEGHSHSFNYSYKKPEIRDLEEEINAYEAMKKKIKSLEKGSN